MWHVVDDITVSEEDDGAVGGEEDEDVPDPVEVGEADPGPVGAEEAVVDPGGERHADDGDTALPQVHHPPVALLDRDKTGLRDASHLIMNYLSSQTIYSQKISSLHGNYASPASVAAS